MRTSCKGISLVEVLAVIVIVAIATAIVIPVISRSKLTSHQSVCLQQIRQVGMACLIYQENYDQRVRSFGVLYDLGILTDRQLTLCPVDPFGGYASKVRSCGSGKEGLNYSYDSILHWFDRLVDRLASVDPNHGILACRLHGERTERSRIANHFCDDNMFYYTGTLLRFRKDGSVQTAKFQFRSPRNANEGPTSSNWDLFTDEKDPEWKY